MTPWGLQAAGKKLASQSWEENEVGQGASPSLAACGPPSFLDPTMSVALILELTGEAVK